MGANEDFELLKTTTHWKLKYRRDSDPPGHWSWATAPTRCGLCVFTDPDDAREYAAGTFKGSKTSVRIIKVTTTEEVVEEAKAK